MGTLNILDEVEAEIARLEQARKALRKGVVAPNGGRALKSLDASVVASLTKAPVALPTLFRAYDGTATDGVSVTSYGQGQVSGVTFTVPAHGEITVDFDLKMQCVTPDDINKMSALIRSLLDASHQSLYDEMETIDVCGGASFFGFFSFGASASYSDTKHRMDSWGLSERNQQVIVDAMMKLSQQMNDFPYHGTIYNRDYDYDVTGNMFAIVMDATITQDQSSNQVRLLAPTPHLQSPDGTTIPTVDPLYKKM